MDRLERMRRGFHPDYTPWPEHIRKHLLGECRKCLAIIAGDLRYGRKPNATDPTLCECCYPDEEDPEGGNQ